MDGRGEAKLAGSRGGRLGDPAWEMRREDRAAAAAAAAEARECGRVGVAPVNREEGTLMRRPELAAVVA